MRFPRSDCSRPRLPRSYPRAECAVHMRSVAAGIVALLIVGIAQADVVINELMYHPYAPFGATNRAEYIEVFNSGTGAVSLANHRFDNGVTFNFPSNYVLGAGGYVVVCRDLEVFTNAYPGVTNVAGDYSGNLRNSGERVTLSFQKNGDWITVDTIEFIDGGVADGEGPSLELVHPGLAALSNASHGDWAASSVRRDVLVAAGAAWRYLDDGSDLGTAWKEPGFSDGYWSTGTAELGYGDGDETTTVNFGNASDKHVTTYFRLTFSATDVSQIAQLNLAMRRDAGAVVYLNGQEIRRDNLPVVGAVSATTYALSPVEAPWREDAFFPCILPATELVEGSNVLAVELHIAEPDTPDLSFNLSLEAIYGGTPGAQNSIYDPNPVPVVADVAHEPPLPPAGSSVAITARARGATDEAVAGVTLNYRIDANPQASWSQSPMLDNGKGGDTLAGDGVYTCMLPVFEGTAMGEGSMFEFTVTATGTNALEVTMPVTNATDVTVPPPYSYLVKFGEDVKYDGEYDTFHVLLTKVNKASLDAQANPGMSRLLDCTIVTDDGDIFYNSSVRHRGNSSYQQPFSYRFEFPRGQPYKGSREWNLNHQRAILQYLGFKVFTESGHGAIAPEPHLARIWLNEQNKTDYTGNAQFQNIFMRFLPIDNTFIENHYPQPAGNIYRGQNGTYGGLDNQVFDPPAVNQYLGDYLLNENDPLTAWYDLEDLCALLTTNVAAYPQALTNRANARQWGRVYGTQVAIENSEGGFHCARKTQGDDHFIYSDPRDGQFDLLPWDMDQVIQQGAGGGGNAVDVNRSIWAFLNNNTGSLADDNVVKFLFNPPVVSYYVGDIVDVHETVLNQPNMSAMIDAMGSAVSPAYRTQVLGDVALRRNSVWSQINSNITVTVPGAVANGPIASIVAGSAVGLTGEGPQGYTTAIRINGTAEAEWNTRQGTWSVGGQQVVSATYPGVNQNVNAWVHLGSTSLHGSGTEQIRVRRVTALAKETIADAIMLSNATSVIIVDNADAGQFQLTETWTLEGHALSQGGNFYWSKSPGATATWTPPPFPAGTYDMYARSIAYGRFGTSDEDATYEVLQSNDILLTSTVNAVEVSALDAEGNLLDSHTHLVIAQGTTNAVSGALATSTTWNAQSGTIVVTDDLTVAPGVTLTIAGNVVILLAPGKRVLASGGTVALGGAPGAPVQFLPSDGGSAWSIVASGGGSVTGAHAVLTGGRLVAEAGGTVQLEDAQLGTYSGTNGIVASSAGGYVTLRRCIVSDYDTMRITGGASIEACLLSDMQSAAVAFASGTGTVASTTLRDPAPASGADGITVFDGGSVTVSNCLVSGNFGTGLGTAQGSGASRLTARHNLVSGCVTGLSFVASQAVTIDHNTIAACRLGAGGGTRASLDSIAWDNVRTTDGLPVFSYSDVQIPGTNISTGVGNLNRNPWFRDPGNGDYRLRDISPCLAAAHDGSDMGPAYPVGANPAAPSALALANGLVTGTNSVSVSWQDNSADESRFEVERALADGGWTRIATLPADSTNYMDIAVPQNSQVSYRVRVAHERGASFYTATESLTTSFGDAAQYLRITEIMYNPPDPSGGELPLDHDEFEFLEFANLGSEALDLSGLRFTSGLTFMFPTGTVLQSGERFVLAQNGLAFTNRYPGTDYDALFTDGHLSNGGEALELSDPGGGIVLAFTFDDAWYPSTDRNGHSLVLVDPDGDLSSPAAWRPSGNVLGTPGEADTSPFVGTVVINEVFSHTDPPYEDAIELYNAGTVAVEIANWYLSDDEFDLTRYRITNATLSIPAGGYHVLYQGTSFGQGADPFALSELGDSVYLSSGDGAQVTSYRTSVKFGAAANGVSFGRHMRSDGVADFTAMSNQTFGIASPASVAEFRTGTGQSNSYPRVGPVVINEIMYNPSATGKEFVELLNTATTNVPLYRGTNVWTFDGAMEFAFPANTTMAPGEHVLVVSIDPTLFRMQFGLTNPALQVFGPFLGALNNAGESVKLYRPGPPEIGGFIPRIRTDRVKYDDEAPWPIEADNGGPSLERVDRRAHGNDPANWIAASFGGTPGAPNNATLLPTVAFTVTTASSVETNGTVLVGVSISPLSTATVVVDYVVSGGTASNALDYELPAGQAIFWPYDSEQVIPLTIKDDAEVEPDETIALRLTAVSGGARLAGNRTYTHTIVDTDATALDEPGIFPPGTNLFKISTVVTMSTDIVGAEIRYTLDGKTPTLSDNLYTGQVTLASSTRIKARTFLGSLNQSSNATALYLEQTAPPEGIVSRRILANSDDAEESKERFPSVVTTAGTLNLGYVPAKIAGTAVGLRFVDVNIVQGATIDKAYIQFTAAATGSSTAHLKIYGEASDSPVTFVGGSGNNITARPDTSARVPWNNVPAWTTGAAGINQQTPDLKAIVQELIDRPGWTTNSALVIVLEDNATVGNRVAHARDGAPANAPLLYIEFDDGNEGPPPIITGTEGTAEGFKVYWTTFEGKTYAIYKSTNLLSPWPLTPLTSGIPAGPSGTNAFTDTENTVPAAFYRIYEQ